MFTANVKPRPEVCGLKFRDFQLYRSMTAFTEKKKINMCAAILNYTKDKGLSFYAQNVAKRLVSLRPKRIGYKEKTSPHIYL